MKKRVIFLIILMIFCFHNLISEVQIDGRMKMFTSFFLSDNTNGDFFNHESGDFLIKRLNVRLGFSGNINDNISYSIKFDGFTYSGELLSDYNFGETDFLSVPISTEYFSMNLYESYIKINDFLINGLDLTVGKQRISWGSADKLNVVDNLNPLDFANFFTFDPDYSFERRPQNSINFEYYFANDWKLQFIILLQHQVSPLPFGYSYMIKSNENAAFDNINLISTWKSNISELNYGLRFEFNLINTDFGLTYYQGNFTMPVLYGIEIGNDKSASFIFPKYKSFGIDFSSEILGFGIWGELNYFIPDDVKGFLIMPVFINNSYNIIYEKFSLLKENFLKFVIGFDYNFGNGFYINFQYLHGFFDELNYSDKSKELLGYKKGMFNGEIEDYLFVSFSYKFNNDSSKIEVGTLYEISDNNSFSLFPNLEFKIKDGLFLQFGGFFVLSGNKDSKFGNFKNDKMAYSGFKIIF